MKTPLPAESKHAPVATKEPYVVHTNGQEIVVWASSHSEASAIAEQSLKQNKEAF